MLVFTSLRHETRAFAYRILLADLDSRSGELRDSWREQIRAVSAVRRREEIGGTGAKHVRRRIADTGCCSKPRYGDGAYGD